jgi:translation elongation factor EF-Tu-like GTPase
MKVLARIKLLSTEKGGRQKALVGPFRLNHSFAPGEFVIANVEQPSGEALAPGHHADLVVDFLPETAPSPLTSGVEWRIFDGPDHLIGHGTVIEVLNR